jgi:hypothetical protein
VGKFLLQFAALVVVEVIVFENVVGLRGGIGGDVVALATVLLSLFRPSVVLIEGVLIKLVD